MHTPISAGALDGEDSISTSGVKNMLQEECACCGRKVRSDENYLKAHLWASTAWFHWECFIALMKGQGCAAAEDTLWKASRIKRAQ
jgi:hypothetical protein